MPSGEGSLVRTLSAFVANARISILLIPVIFGYYFIQASLGRIILPTPDPVRTSLAIVSMMAVGASGAYWNSIVDIDIDKVNHPTWPVPSGILSVRVVRIASVFFAAISIILGSLVSAEFLFLAAATLFLAAAYSLPPFRLKTRFWLRYSCHAAIIMVLLPLSFWVVYAGLDAEVIAAVAVLFIFRFLAWGAKDIKDMPGDRKGNVATVATRYGEKRALQLFAFAVLLCWGIDAVLIDDGIIHNPLLMLAVVGLPAITVIGRTVRARRVRRTRLVIAPDSVLETKQPLTARTKSTPLLPPPFNRRGRSFPLKNRVAEWGKRSAPAFGVLFS